MNDSPYDEDLRDATPAPVRADTPAAPPAAFHPFSTLEVPPPVAQKYPPEPPIKSVVAWMEGKFPRVAVHADDTWFVDGIAHDSFTWAELCDRWESLDIDRSTVGIAAAWTPMFG